MVTIHVVSSFSMALLRVSRQWRPSGWTSELDILIFQSSRPRCGIAQRFRELHLSRSLLLSHECQNIVNEIIDSANYSNHILYDYNVWICKEFTKLLRWYLFLCLYKIPQKWFAQSFRFNKFTDLNSIRCEHSHIFCERHPYDFVRNSAINIWRKIIAK